MSECDLCNEYSDDLHPVDFQANPNNPRCPEEIKEYLGIGNFLDDTEALQAAEEFWDKCAHICHDCFREYAEWIVWWG